MGNQQLSKENQIRFFDRGFPELRILYQSIGKLDFNVGKMEQILHYSNLSSKNDSTAFQTRFQSVIVPLPDIKKDDLDEAKQGKLKKWLGIMIKSVLSRGFHEFQNDTLSLKQTKIFCSENILLNLVNYSRKYHPSPETIKYINHILKQQLLPYCLIRYPQSEQAQINLKLSNRIKKTNNLENNQNDLVYKSKIQFKYQQDQNYNSIIMKFLNYIIQLPQKKLSKNNLSLFQPLFGKKRFQQEEVKERQEKQNVYELFQNDFQELFEKLMNENEFQRMKNIDIHALQASQNSENNNRENQKLSEKSEIENKRGRVENYTKYLIGRKLSENIKTFTEEQIKQGCLELKNSSLMRVITKWCKQLRKNFKNPQKVAYKERQFRMTDGSQRYLNHTQSFALELLLERRQQKIKQYLDEVMKNNYEHQSQIFNTNISQKLDMDLFSEQETTVGLLATVNRKNYQTYLIGYLNVLLHNLLSVMEEFQSMRWYYIVKEMSQQTLQQKMMNNLESFLKQIEKEVGESRHKEIRQIVPNLITFKVADLLRCKCSSREDQINAIYNQIERISSQEPELFEIIEIENRLQRGTKDIQIFLMYRQQLVIEVQLAINEHKSKFIDCSDKFNHYIYELKRSQFGPISQLCSIWMNYDNRSDFYQNKFEQENKKRRRTGFLNTKLKLIQDNEEKVRFRSLSPRKSMKINLQQDKNSLNIEEPTLQRLESTIERKQNKGEIKQFSLPFRCFNCNYYYNQSYFLGGNQYWLNDTKKICLRCVLQNLSTYDNIRASVMPELPELPVQALKSAQSITKINSAANFPQYGIFVLLKSKNKIPKYFKKIVRGKKEYAFEKTGKNYRNLGEVTTNQQKKQFLEDNLVFKSPTLKNQVVHISEQQVNREYFLPKLLTQANELRRTSIKLANVGLRDKDLQKIAEPLLSVKKANFSQNKIKSIEYVSKGFPNLEILILNFNEINSATGIGKLTNLQQLNLKHNRLKNLPSSIQNLTNLHNLYLSSNQLQIIPQSIGSLKLEHLSFQSNKLTQLPNSFSNLKHLTRLQLGRNFIKKLPNNLGEIPLQQLNIEFNQIKQLPNSFGTLTNLKYLDLSNNKVHSLPQSFGSLSSLEILFLTENNLTVLPDNFGNLGYLQTLELSKNMLTYLPQSFCQLTQLRKCYISENKLKILPKNFHNLKLKEINLRKNELQQLPQKFGENRKLNYLYLSENLIKQLPQSFGKLENLYFLALKQNKLSELPTTFSKLKNLGELILSSNKLQSLSKDFQNLKKLQALDLSSNQFRQIPQVLFRMNNWKLLNISNNKITQLTIPSFQIQSMNILNLKSNPILRVSKNIAQLPIKVLYLDEQHLDSPSKFIYEKIKKKFKNK